MNPFWIENGLHPRIIDILSGKGITAFTPVQGEAFLPIMKGRDVIGRSRTGTGTFFWQSPCHLLFSLVPSLENDIRI